MRRRYKSSVRSRPPVAGTFDFRDGKLGILELEFLQADHVRLIGGEPIQQVRQADVQRIDIPGSQLHALLVLGRGLTGVAVGLGGFPAGFDFAAGTAGSVDRRITCTVECRIPAFWS